MRKVKILIQLGIIIILSLVIAYKVGTDVVKENSNTKENVSYSINMK